jgi:nucleoid DNA-binding protein
MVKLTKLLAKKTGISRKDLDGLLKVIGHEITEELRAYHRFDFPNLGYFFCVTKEGVLHVRIKLSEEAYNRLNRIDNSEERKDEIIFD